MENKLTEKFQMSPYFTASTLSHNGTEEGTHKSRKPTKVLRRTSRQLETHSVKRDRSNICPDGKKVNAKAITTKSSINAAIGTFTKNTNCQESDAHTPTKHYAPRPPLEPSLVAVVTTHGYPLHVALEDSPCVKATHSTSKLKYY